MGDHNFNKNIETYSNNYELMLTLRGRLNKNALRVDDDTESFKMTRQQLGQDCKKEIKDSQYFGELFQSLIDGKSHYKTYLNELFPNNSDDYYIPKYVSCIVKNNNFSSLRCCCECLGSRLANLLKIDTVFNLALQTTDSLINIGKPYYDTIVSVDFIPKGYRMETFDTYGLFFKDNISIEELLNLLDQNFNKIIAKENLTDNPQNYLNLKKSIVKQYLFRTLLCEDFDFCDRNTAILMSDNGDYYLAPAFDYEYLFKLTKTRVVQKKFIKNNIEYLQQTMPDILNDFMSILDEKINDGSVESVIKNSLDMSALLSHSIYRHIIKNYEILKIATQKSSERIINSKIEYNGLDCNIK